jgi:Domain of unknown function (DUF4375)
MQARDYWRLVEPIWQSVSIYQGPDTFLRQFNAAPQQARTLLAAHWCQSEVCNGGFLQFFYNPTSVLAPEASEAFRAIGMPLTAEVVAKAAAWFGAEYPREREQRMARLAPFHPRKRGTDPFESLDTEFFRLLDKESGGFITAANQYAAGRISSGNDAA